MADATDLKSVDRKVVWVRLPPSAPIGSITTSIHSLNVKIRNGGNSVARLILVEIIEEDRVSM
jgi:hypothetical protein